MASRLNINLKATGLSRERLHWIDLFRGLAVLILFIDHANVLISHDAPPWLARVVQGVFDVCISMFICVSGMTMSHLVADRKGNVGQTVRRYAVRGIVLLVGCHVLITLGIWPLYWDERSFAEILLLRWHITDAIAFCLWLGPLLVLRLDDTKRLALVFVMLVGSRAIAAFWHPQVAGLGIAKEFLFGANDYDSSTHLLNAYPVGPYLAVFLLGTVVFSFVQRRIRESGPKGAIRLVAGLSVAVLAVGGASVAAYLGMRSALDAERYGDLLAFMYPSQTWGRLPLYLGATGLLLAAVLWRYLSRRRYTRLDFALTVWGRTSLFAFIVQYFVIQSIPAMLGWVGGVPVALLGPLVLAQVGILFLVSYAYARAKGYVTAGEYHTIRACVLGSQGTQTPSDCQDTSLGTDAPSSIASSPES